MIHRVVFGSIERFIPVMIEHFAGAFPTWLARYRFAYCRSPINTWNMAKKVLAELKEAGIRAEIDTKAEKIGYKIREARLRKIPYMLVVGAKEEEDGVVSRRRRFKRRRGQKVLDAFISDIKRGIKNRENRKVEVEEQVNFLNKNEITAKCLLLLYATVQCLHSFEQKSSNRLWRWDFACSIKGFGIFAQETPRRIVTPEWLLCANKKGGSIMPLLVCSAMSCIYNKGEYCSKGDITVGGKEAEQPGETCCESFMARTGNGVTSSAGVPSATIDVGCKACHCQYNEGQCCTASKIDIDGSSAKQKEETQCGTFHCKCGK